MLKLRKRYHTTPYLYCRSLRVDSAEDAGCFVEGAGPSLDTRRLAFIPEYRVYNREREIERQEREKKEKQWEEELNTAMKGAEERLKYARNEKSSEFVVNPLIRQCTRWACRVTLVKRSLIYRWLKKFHPQDNSRKPFDIISRPFAIFFDCLQFSCFPLPAHSYFPPLSDGLEFPVKIPRRHRVH